jgi:nicotinamidase-related amidase
MPQRALVVIDMINTYEHADAEALRRSVKDALPQVRDLISRARHAGARVIYVNDNFGEWRSDHRSLVDKVLAGPHRELIEPIVPDEDALFVVKARHSIFYETPLEYLLRHQSIDELVLTGQATEQCILYSALDAHIRHIPVVVPSDAVAHIHADLAKAALKMMALNLQAEVCETSAVTF